MIDNYNTVNTGVNGVTNTIKVKHISTARYMGKGRGILNSHR